MMLGGNAKRSKITIVPAVFGRISFISKKRIFSEVAVRASSLFSSLAYFFGLVTSMTRRFCAADCVKAQKTDGQSALRLCAGKTSD